jgi:cysteine desulfurase / selenocysteine lyase
MSGAVYLDFAATAAVRPPEVVDAVRDYLEHVGATPGRAGHRRAVDASRVVFRCRRALATLFGIEGDPGRVVFQLNATHALNVALQGMLRPGDRVVRTAYDHNAVRRPLAALAARGVRVDVLAGGPDGSVDLDEAERLLAGDDEPAAMLVLPHVSNVLGCELPVAELAARARAVGACVVLDAAQSAGHLPVAVDALGVDVLAFTGHKGLLGPQGTGGLWIRPGVEVAPLFFGGTGGSSESERMPEALPDRLEAGTQNGPGIAGLLAGVEWLLGKGLEHLHGREVILKQRLLARLRGIAGLRVRSPQLPAGSGIVLVTADRLPSAELARRLDAEHGVQTRGGLHCAPETHALLGTLAEGAVRLSLGWSTSEDDVDRAAAALAAICGPE